MSNGNWGESLLFNRRSSWLALCAACCAWAVAQDANHHQRPPLPTAEALKKLPADGGPDWNRLVFETSPYLLQHAANPIDWRPWGEDAFAEAVAQDKPIFLSIGYATCHWCHVMERESFVDAEVAALLNKHFIAVKVDREERPDIDEIYMTACQAMTGRGGWPLTCVLDHDGAPFFAGTYLPKRGNGSNLGLMELLARVTEIWNTDRPGLIRQGQRVVEAIQRASRFEAGGGFTAADLDAAYASLQDRFDADHGGFSAAPKFPTPQNLAFLLRYWKRSGDARALAMVRKTLTAMRMGGVYDHLGFGFHRYATDANWLTPHFEKMLYDQALLAIAYLEGYLATGDPLFAQTAREIFTYVARDMTAPEGGFYSAEDADSEGEEGKFYLWTPAQTTAVLGQAEGVWFNQLFNIVTAGNYREHTSTGVRVTERSIAHMTKPPAVWAEETKADPGALQARLEAARAKLFAAREKRIRPIKDDKVLTDWNGLMIAAYAIGAKSLDEPAYAQAAARAAEFVLRELRDDQGALRKRWRLGKAGLRAHLDDYAFLVWGLLELYEADFNPRWLRAALDLTERAIALFEDEANGGFFLASGEDPLVARSKTVYDGALPSGNSVMAMNLIRLGRVTAGKRYPTKAQALFKAFSGWASQRTGACNHLLLAVDFAIGPSAEIVIVGAKPDARDVRAMTTALYREFAPNKVVLFRPQRENPAIVAIAPYTAAQRLLNGRAAAYVCQDFACKLPTADPAQMLANLRSLQAPPAPSKGRD